MRFDFVSEVLDHAVVVGVAVDEYFGYHAQAITLKFINEVRKIVPNVIAVSRACFQ